MSDALSPITAYLNQRKAQGMLRTLKPVGPSVKGHTLREGRSFLNFSSNNYLGLAQDPLLIERAQDWTERWGAGAMASRVVCGTMDIHEQIEQKVNRQRGGVCFIV